MNLIVAKIGSQYLARRENLVGCMYFIMDGLFVSSMTPGKHRTLRVFITKGFHIFRCSLVNKGLSVDTLKDQCSNPAGGSGSE